MDSTTQIVVYSTDARFFTMIEKWAKERFLIEKPAKYITTEDELYEMAGYKEHVMIFYFSHKWADTDSDLVRYVKKHNPNVKLVMVSSSDVALSAWRRDAFYFVPMSHADNADIEAAFFLNHAYKKFLSIGKSQNDTDYLKIRYIDELILLAAQDICYIEANGNYCYIITATRKIKTTQQIGKIEKWCSPYPSLIRIGKSFIINTERIKTIDTTNGVVYFISTKSAELGGLSDRYINKIKQAIK